MEIIHALYDQDAGDVRIVRRVTEQNRGYAEIHLDPIGALSLAEELVKAAKYSLSVQRREAQDHVAELGGGTWTPKGSGW